MRIRLAVALVVSIGAIAALAVGAAARSGDDDGDRFAARLVGYHEVNSKSTVAFGSFRAELDDGTLEYTLTFSNLETPSLFAHIHFAEEHVNGGISAFLCGGGDKPACPATSGTVTGVIDPADVI